MTRENALKRRTQFSSCDNCRRSRVACDASKHGYQPGRLRWRGSCSRCSRRKRPCTFEWIANTKSKTSNTLLESDIGSPNIREEPLYADMLHDQTELASEYRPSIDSVCPDLFSPPQPEPITSILKRWSSQFFPHACQVLFGSSVGKNGCPLIEGPIAENMLIPDTNCFQSLDICIDESHQCMEGLPGVLGNQEQRDNQFDRYVQSAICAFTSQWLPLVLKKNQYPQIEIEETIRESWRTAREDMLKVVNRTSYRSVLTLYLFSQTPIPKGITKNEELDGISGAVCIQNAFIQVQRLRGQHQGCRLKSSEVAVWIRNAQSYCVPNVTIKKAQSDLESRVYWTAITWDTSNSLTANLRSSLTSGQQGACSEPTWQSVRRFISRSFPSHTTQDWREAEMNLSDEDASCIICAAEVAKVYTWKNIASLKEALREGVDEESVSFVWSALLAAIGIFESSVRPRLRVCERRLLFLGQQNRFNWYKVSLDYCLGILMLVDTIETAERFDLLPEISQIRQETEYESFNVLKYGLENTYAMPELGVRTPTASSPNRLITASLIAFDPCPQSVVNTVILMGRVVDEKFRQNQINVETCSYLSSILLNALQQPPQYSNIVQNAEKYIQRLSSI